MKNKLFLAGIFLLHFESNAQTYHIEKERLNDMYRSGKINATEAAEMKREFESIVNQRGGYPVLPYDSLTNTYNFTHVVSLPGIQKKAIYRRIKEWCAIRAGNIDATLRHDDEENGKIINKAYVPITYQNTYETLFGQKRTSQQIIRSYYTLIVTVKDEKMKIEFNDLRFEFITLGYLSGSIYIPETRTETYFQNLFPIVESDKGRYWGLMDLADQTLKTHKWFVSDLEKYIKDWQRDYGF